MLQVTIKDNNTNEVIYDGQVSVINMHATEEDEVRSVWHISNEASLFDMLNCIEAVKKASQDLTNIVAKSINQTIDVTLFSGLNDAE